jgi:hypothetical protein
LATRISEISPDAAFFGAALKITGGAGIIG